MITRRRTFLAALLPFTAAEATPMQVRRGSRSFDAVRVTEPLDPAAISAALPGASVQVVGGAVEVGLNGYRVFAGPGSVVLHDRATGVLSKVAADEFVARCEVVR